ncbi:MAG TPA: outer membrane beta-barrel protein [Flavisolibacter sp.]
MKKILAVTVLSVIAFFANAQLPGMPGAGQRNGGQMPTGRFYGKIVDASNKGIDAASVTLVTERMDSATRQRKEVIVGGMLTSGTGDFSVENVPLMGRYKLRVTGIGYKSYEQAVAFEMPNRNAAGNDPMAMLGAIDKDLGNIKLEIDDKVLGGVTVTANRPLLQMGIDRKVFNVDRNLVSQGGTAVDVMKNVPSINVDIDGNVTLRNSAPQIFVDGRPTNLTLEQIPADAIESVEIITNPSAKFDASGGTAGILNIVLKKNKRVGYSGNIRANIDTRAKVGIGGDINVRQNKINVFASGQFNQRKSIGNGITERQNIFGTRQVNTYQTEKTIAEGQFGFLRGGIDYFIDNRNTLTISGSMARGGMDPSIFSDTRIDSLFNSVSEFQERRANSENQFRNWGTQLSFKHNFPKAGREWTADVTMNQGRNENNNIINTDYFKGNMFDRTYFQSQTGSGSNKNLVIQTDYSNPINDKSKFEIGARASIRELDNNLSYMISGKTSSTVYNNKDRVYAAYATYSNRIKDFGYQLGLRAESSDNQGILNGKDRFEMEFPISLFPSVFLSQKLSETDDLQLNYSRRINRPGFWQLFPFTDYSDSLNISRGNPDLDPEFTNSLELSYSKIFENRDNLIASVYFKNTNNLITSIFRPEFDTVLNRDSVLVSSYVNANRSYVTGLELTSRNKITKWWDITSNANFFTSKIDLDDQPDPDQFLSYFLKLNNSFRLPKNISIQLSADYQSKIISAPGGRGGGGRGGFGGGGGGMFGGGGQSAAQGFIRPNFGMDAGIRFEFLKNRTASLSLNVNDILRTRKYDAHTESLPFFIQDVQRRRDPQVARLAFNWRFGKMDATLFKRKNTRAESDVNMDAGGF